MAWNQPSGPNNPWGRRPGAGGPDLDERLKSWQRRLESLLRSGGRGGDSGSLFLMGTLVALGEIVGRSTLDDLLVGSTRPEVTRRTKNLIQTTLDYYTSGITVTTVNLEDVQVPDAVIPSQRDANKAQADKERFILESEAYANGIVPVAQGAALRM